MDLLTIIGIGAGALILIVVFLACCCKPAGKVSPSQKVPIPVQACIISFDSGVQNWEKALPLLKQLRDKKIGLALVTSVPRADFEKRMAQLPMVLDAMDAVVTGNEVTNSSKPAPDLFVEAARRLDVQVDACIAFDDSPAGIEAAQRAHMLTVAVSPNVTSQFNHLMPEFMVCDVADFESAWLIPKMVDETVEAETDEPVSGLVALARLLPPGSAMQKCLLGQVGGSYNGVGL